MEGCRSTRASRAWPRFPTRLAAAVLLSASVLPPGVARAETELTAPATLRGDWFDQRLNELNHELNGRMNSARAAATLYRMHELSGDLQSLQPLARVYARVVRDRRVHPEVKALATKLLAEVETSRGRLSRARSHVDTLRFAEDGWIVGGFDNEGGTGHDTAFAPENGAIDLEATYAGKENEIRWVRAPSPGLRGRLPVHEVIRPARNATFYFLTTLESSRAGRAVLHLGTSGATRVWVNGQLVHVDGDDHPARFDQRAVGVRLRDGSNPVLVKVSVLDETPALYLRVGDGPSGELAFRAPERGTVSMPVSGPGIRDVVARERPVELDDLVSVLRRQVASSPRDGALREDYARVLAARRPFDSKSRLHRTEQEKAAELLPRSAATHTTLAAWITDDHNRRRLALERALKSDPSWVPARIELGEYYLSRGFPRRALAELERAAADRPDHPLAALRLNDALDSLSLDARSQRRIFQLAQRFPTSPDVVLAAARTERMLGRRAEAVSRYRVLISMRYDHPARSELANLLLDGGDVAGAVTELQRALELSPASTALGLRLASVLSHNGRPEEALALYDRLAGQSPLHEGVLEARGHHKLRQGDESGALGDFEAALALRPQNARLREVVRSVLPQENFAAPYLRDAVALAAEEQARDAEKEAMTRGADAVVLANVEVVRVYPNGLSSRVRQSIVRVVTQRGVEQTRVQGIRYTPGDQEVRVEQARLVRPDGSVVESASQNDRRLTDSWSGMYFDARQRIVAFQDVRPGDVVELTYRLDDVSSENMFADYFGDVRFLQGTAPQRLVEYVLIAPASREFFTNEPRLDGLRHEVEHHERGRPDDERRIWRWAASDVPRLESEPRMPGWANLVPYLHVSTFRDWDHMARFWWGLIRDQLHITPDVRAAAEEAVAGIPKGDVTGRIHAVHRYVVEKTRYVGLEFGIHGFKPYRVDQVLSRRFGDCKDKAALMYAMLKHLGIESKLVLIRTRNMGHLDPQPVSLAVFNHAILYVPSHDLFLDGTAEFSGPSELPFSDQDAQALIVEEDPNRSSRFLVTPTFPATANTNETQLTVRLAPEGAARIEGVSTITGEGAAGYRQAYESESGRRERFEQGYGRSYPGARVTSFDISEPRAIGQPVELRFELEVPRLGRADGDGTRVFSPFGEPFRYSQWLAPLSRREHPVDLGHPWHNTYDVLLQLPEGMRLADEQVRFEKSTRFGSYLLELTPSEGSTTGEVARMRVELSLAGGVVSPADYPELRAFLQELDRTLSRPVRVIDTSTAPALSTAEAGR